MPLVQTIAVVALLLLGHCPSPTTTTTTTTSSAVCKTSAGVGVPDLAPGDSIQLGAGCANCSCREDGLAECQMPTCPKLPCWDGRSSSPLCCATCPQGRNCRTPGGTVLNETASVVESGKTCQCSNFTCGEGCQGPAATCTPLPPSTSPTPTTITTTPAPIVCRLQNGTVLKIVENPGVVWKSQDGCRKCSCDTAGKVTCLNVTCGVTPSCEDRMNVTGRCCEVCGFDVGICLLASKYQVKMRKPVRMSNDTRCICRKGKKAMKLNCYLPSPGELRNETEKITRILNKLVRLRRKLYRLQNAVIDIEYP